MMASKGWEMLLMLLINSFPTGATEESALNVTALRGLDATLPCTIEDSKQGSDVVWMDKVDNVLYYNEIRIIDDERFTLAKLGNRWDLTIREINSKDEGRYKCIDNLQPLLPKFYYLTVFVPPSIVVEDSSPDVEAPEGTTVRLFCNATGYPTPTITWSFRKAGEAADSPKIQKIQQSGSTLQIQNVSRYLDVIYTCTANNSFEKPDTHEIRLKVRYKPVVRVWPGKISKSIGDSVNLTCRGQGYRLPRIYFAKDSLEIMDDGEKYIYSRKSDGHWTQLILTIHDLEDEDFGYYKCAAINSMGKSDQFIELTNQMRRLPRPMSIANSTKITTSTPRPTRRTMAKIQNLPPELKNRSGPKSYPSVAQDPKSNSGATNLSQQMIFLLTICHILHLTFYLL